MKWRQVVCGVAAAFALAGCASVATPPRAGIAEGAYPAPLLDQTAERPQDKERKARIDLALAYLELGRVDVALDEIAKARALDASDPLVPYAWGLAHLALGDRATAEKSLEEAQRLAPNDPDILHALGSLRCSAGRFEEGLALLRQAAMNPYYPRRARSLANHAWCAWRAGDESSVQNEIDMALALQPDDFLVQVRALQWAARNRQWAIADRHLERLVQRAPDDPMVWWLAANLAHAKGDRLNEARWAERLRQEAPNRLETRKLERGEWESW
ncbi:tetratricopeptide repeat protein [Hydrogenophilus thermoluteolus]|nr:tetratricopeptide repeat protein [Hydrogenophilus thermoluteolus]MBW7656466.1 tetratricopeptide repeat protein [Hydrogenophilus thermoluteolus]HNQ48200.1 tetratricopeptide repeat protein [Hydrogenophilus thermoluteolus]HNU20195.1 tetratricopeptide repeat protein [Hydrogenophilus thermoluteolus]